MSTIFIQNTPAKINNEKEQQALKKLKVQLHTANKDRQQSFDFFLNYNLSLLLLYMNKEKMKYRLIHLCSFYLITQPFPKLQ